MLVMILTGLVYIDDDFNGRWLNYLNMCGADEPKIIRERYRGSMADGQ